MKIAIMAPLVTPIREPQRGGSQAFVADLARGLTDRGHEVHVYAATGSQIPGVRVVDTGVDARSLASTLYRADAAPTANVTAAEAAFSAAYAHVQPTRYDVIHNHAFDPPAVRLAAMLPSPVAHTLHLPPDKRMAAELSSAARGTSRPAVAVVSQSQATAWRQVIPVDAILPPYVPTASIAFAPAASDGAVFAGRFSPEKGVAEAIDIARAAGIPIDVYGDSYDDDYTKAEVDSRRTLAGVTVHAGVTRTLLWTALAKASVVLCPAKWDEPFGMVAAEAQACGTPVVAFNRGGLSEVIVDSVTGFLVRPDDVAGAAEAVRHVAALSRRACREHAERNLDFGRTLDAHEQFYRQVANGGAVNG